MSSLEERKKLLKNLIAMLNNKDAVSSKPVRNTIRRQIEQIRKEIESDTKKTESRLTAHETTEGNQYSFAYCTVQ